MRVLAAILLCVTLALPAWAVNPDEILKDPVLEARARALSTELRCLVCQNQSIDDSDAPLAKDLRILLRERLQAGDSDSQVISYLVDRYGEFILLKPYFGRHTLLLWLLPFVLLGVGIVIVVMGRRRSQRVAVQDGLSAEENERLKTLLD
ncbi:MAG: cytochrome c-type biogenesis protein CcmH [Alphaproteobacteria bacterium]|nr:cytochrome c-type biogenesis protein CcmH [Alphaproteobacteria bacterium]